MIHDPTQSSEVSQRGTTPGRESSGTTRSVAVPIYDEYPGLWMALVDRLLDAGFEEVVLAVDEPDDEARRAVRRYETDERVRVTVSEQRRGKGGSLLDALDAASGDVLGFVDADGAVSVPELACIYGLVESDDADVAIGSRNLSGERRESQSILRRGFSAGYGTLARRVTGVPVQDFQCGVKAVSREVYEAIGDDLAETGYAFDTDLLAHAHHAGFRIREVSIDWNDPGDSSVSVIRDVPRMFGALRRIRRAIAARPDERPADAGPRIALVSSHPPGRGHLAEYCEELAAAYGERDTDLAVLAQRSSYAPPVEHREDYVVRRLWERDSLSGAVALLRELLTGDYDVIHFNAHMTWFGTKNRYRFFGLALPPLLSRLLDAAVVTTLHDLLEVVEDEVIEEEVGVVQALGAVFATQVLLLGDATTVTSEEYREVVTSRYKASNVYHVPHGTFASETATPSVRDPPLRILLFGHLSPSKDVETVVEALDLLHESVPDAELWIAGDSHPGYPGYREDLEKRFSGTPGVRFTGYVEDYELDDLWDGATLLVMPYRTCTGVSGVFQLAKSYGTPTVAFDTKGMRTSTVGTGGAATFVEPGDAEELAGRIAGLWHDPERLEDLARENAAASTAWTIDDTAEQFLDIFADLRDGADGPDTEEADRPDPEEADRPGPEATDRPNSEETPALGAADDGSSVDDSGADETGAAGVGVDEADAPKGRVGDAGVAEARAGGAGDDGATASVAVVESATDAEATADPVSDGAVGNGTAASRGPSGATDATNADLVGVVAGTTCPWPDCDGTLGRGAYKDTAAAVCETCGTPAVRTWGTE